ncbi:MAG TPA: carbohydrate porin [Kofleriaceae bacterium]|jgi:maltoporin|nr:carbohydrate porin [Kofleriaceae bacterium]
MSRVLAVVWITIVFGAGAARAQPKPDPCSGEPVNADSPAPDEPEREAPPADEAPPPSAPPPPESKPVDTGGEVEHIVPPPRVDTGFTFGSYGRVIVGSDLRGGDPEQIKVVAHAPRIVEPTYLELQFGYGFFEHGTELRTVTTLAFDDTLFHYTGKFDAGPALRNMYLEAFPTQASELWVGSRMYRGDDIYLFDYWPLDDINTVGGGGSYDFAQNADGKQYVRLAAHVGFNRLLNDFQYQTREVPNPEQGASVVTQLNRQRVIASTTLTINDFPDFYGRTHGKIKLHAEVQGLPSGTRLLNDMTPQTLPADWGTTIGAQLGLWGFTDPDDTTHARHLNLFARWSRGLSAYDELAPPTELDTSLKTFPRASEIVFGLSGAWDTSRWNVMVGAESRRFVGAGPRTDNPDNGWEYALDVRPLALLGHDVYAGADLSFQARFPRGLNPTSQLAEDPGVTQIAPMLVYSPMGAHAYARPQLRLVYRAAFLNQGALDLYVPDDPRHAHSTVHFFGLQAEWWFNSSYR